MPERCLLAGDKILVLGGNSPPPAATVSESDIGLQAGQRIAEWKKDMPALIRRFDLNGRRPVQRAGVGAGAARRGATSRPSSQQIRRNPRTSSRNPATNVRFSQRGKRVPAGTGHEDLGPGSTFPASCSASRSSPGSSATERQATPPALEPNSDFTSTSAISFASKSSMWASLKPNLARDDRVRELLDADVVDVDAVVVELAPVGDGVLQAGDAALQLQEGSGPP